MEPHHATLRNRVYSSPKFGVGRYNVVTLTLCYQGDNVNSVLTDGTFIFLTNSNSLPVEITITARTYELYITTLPVLVLQQEKFPV